MYERRLKTELFGFGSVWLGLREPISVKEISIFGAVCGRKPHTWFLGERDMRPETPPYP